MSYEYDVFLGGSCGASNWRQEAIAHFQRLGVTFFNPQRDCWEEGMVKVERQAKENSRILLFVVDWKQRSLVTLIEIVYLAAVRAPLVVVLPDEHLFPGSSRDCTDRQRAMQFVRRVLQYERIPTCVSLSEALGLIETIVLKNMTFKQIVSRPQCVLIFLKWIVLFVGRVCSLPATLLLFMAIHAFLDEPAKIRLEYVLRYRHPNLVLACRVVKYMLLIAYLCLSPMLFFVFFFCSLAMLYIVLPGLKKLSSIKTAPSSTLTKMLGYQFDIYVGGANAVSLKTNPVYLSLKKSGFSFTFSDDCAVPLRFDSISSSGCVFFAFSCADNFLEQFVEVAYSMGIGAFVVANFDTVSGFNQDCCASGTANGSTTTDRESAIRRYRRAIFYLKDMGSSTLANFFENDLNGAAECLLRRAVPPRPAPLSSSFCCCGCYSCKTAGGCCWSSLVRPGAAV